VKRLHKLQKHFSSAMLVAQPVSREVRTFETQSPNAFPLPTHNWDSDATCPVTRFSYWNTVVLGCFVWFQALDFR